MRCEPEHPHLVTSNLKKNVAIETKLGGKTLVIFDKHSSVRNVFEVIQLLIFAISEH